MCGRWHNPSMLHAAHGRRWYPARLVALALVPLLLGFARTASAWGVAAHRAVSLAALDRLPAGTAPFLAAQADWIGERSVAADWWRGVNEPFSKAAEDPNHAWYLEQFAFLTEVPRSRDAFVLAVYDEHRRLTAAHDVAAAMTNIHYTGTLPYAVMEAFGRLQATFRVWRDTAARHEPTTFVERDAAYHVGTLSHYVADGAMPLHTSIHNAGWVGDNPRGFTRDGGIHWQFENDFVNLIGLTRADIAPRVPATPRVLEDPFRAVLDHLTRSHTRLTQVYALEQQGALAREQTPDARALVYACTTDAAALLRDLMVAAWDGSARPVPTLPEQAQPNSPRNPQYDPATGSAPAPVPPVRP